MLFSPEAGSPEPLDAYMLNTLELPNKSVNCSKGSSQMQLCLKNRLETWFNFVDNCLPQIDNEEDGGAVVKLLVLGEYEVSMSCPPGRTVIAVIMHVNHAFQMVWILFLEQIMSTRRQYSVF